MLAGCHFLGLNENNTPYQVLIFAYFDIRVLLFFSISEV